MFDWLKAKQHRVIEDPAWFRLVFGDARFSALWLIVRILIGWQWLDAASQKIADPAWIVTGTALRSFWTSAVAIPEGGRPAITYDWYRDFIQSLLDSGSAVWFARLIAAGELLVGTALVIGAFVGIAAFFGAFMNFNYLLAGSASINPVLFIGALLLILAWKIAGFIGADYYLLDWLGTPWGRGKVIEEAAPTPGKH